MDENQRVETSVKEAVTLYKRYANALMKESSFVSLLQKYSDEIHKSSQIMEDIGLPNFCSYCATNIPGGGCCGSHIATWYDPILLLINLLMEVKLQQKSYYEDCCRFLGKQGCTLKARYHFCVNYLCKGIYESFDKTLIDRLRAQSGRELFTGWEVELFIRDFLTQEGYGL